MKSNPIGFFDSGLGGLSVLSEAVKEMPHENFIYFGDNGYAPYGSKSREEIFRRANWIVDFLLRKNVKAIVIACNTATGVAVKELREMHQLPIISMEPAIKVAQAHQQDGKIVVMATPATLVQQKYRSLVEHLGCGDDVIPLPCDGLVELIEDGKLEGQELEAYLERLLQPLRSIRVDSVVLGCTHYSFVQEQIEKILAQLGQAPIVVDGGRGTVRHLKELLIQAGQYRDSGEQSIRIYTSGNPTKMESVVKEAVGDQEIEVVS